MTSDGKIKKKIFKLKHRIGQMYAHLASKVYVLQISEILWKGKKNKKFKSTNYSTVYRIVQYVHEKVYIFC